MIRNILKNLKLILVVFIVQKFKIFIKKTQFLYFWPEKNCVFLLIYKDKIKTVRLSGSQLRNLIYSVNLNF